MNKQIIYLIFISLLLSCQIKQDISKDQIVTICNPMDIRYRFCIEEPSRREAADPTVVSYRDLYFLFASKSGGYWYSDDLSKWNFIETEEIPIEEYAPTVIKIDDILYFLASSNEKSTIYKSDNPMSGHWTVAVEELEFPVWDPAFFLDNDKRLYLYWGCSDKNPIYGIELDYKNDFAFIGKPHALIKGNTNEHGWEVPGDNNQLKETNPWIEGAWMNKYQGKYYLQYSGPGTEFKSYSDAVYTSDYPLGPFKLQDHNPFSSKPEGFASAAGHGSTFQDKHGNYWHIATSTISVKHIFERRLVLYPTFFDSEGVMYCSTSFGDYPFIIPNKKIENAKDGFPEWMLLSYHKPLTVSSELDSFPALNMNDENLRTYWAAKSGNPNEFVSIDLGDKYDVYAIQINFAEHLTEIYGRQKGLSYQYLIEYSNDNRNWKLLIDQSNNQTDESHDYHQLLEKINCRYLRIKNIKVPSGNIAISGFRVFGKGSGQKPELPKNFTVIRKEDRREAKLSWQTSKKAIGYQISYGIAKDKLYQKHLVYQNTSLDIRNLNTNLNYYFTIEAFNENGIISDGEILNIE